mmetsp:Transcript_5068/g.12072  ORF Transcript_5068/g.12072 Transcript_5068/m.12072 type:complete len:308 (+) Transcript_5068:79-1002(+)
MSETGLVSDIIRILTVGGSLVGEKGIQTAVLNLPLPSLKKIAADAGHQVSPHDSKNMAKSIHEALRRARKRSVGRQNIRATARCRQAPQPLHPHLQHQSLQPMKIAREPTRRTRTFRLDTAPLFADWDFSSKQAYITTNDGTRVQFLQRPGHISGEELDSDPKGEIVWWGAIKTAPMNDLSPPLFREVKPKPQAAQVAQPPTRKHAEEEPARATLGASGVNLCGLNSLTDYQEPEPDAFSPATLEGMKTYARRGLRASKLDHEQHMKDFLAETEREQIEIKKSIVENEAKQQKKMKLDENPSLDGKV